MVLRWLNVLNVGPSDLSEGVGWEALGLDLAEVSSDFNDEEKNFCNLFLFHSILKIYDRIIFSKDYTLVI